MSTPNSVITPQTPKSSSAVVTAANTSYGDTPTTPQVLFTAGASGARVTKVTALARATAASAIELQLFRDHDGSGTTKRFFRSRLMAAYTVAQTTAQTEVDFGYTEAAALILGPGEKLYANIGVANTGIVFTAEGADY